MCGHPNMDACGVKVTSVIIFMVSTTPIGTVHVYKTEDCVCATGQVLYNFQESYVLIVESSFLQDKNKVVEFHT